MSGDDSAALLTASIRSFLDGGDASEARLRALLLDDLGASGRGSRELVDAAVRAYGLGIVSGVDRRMVRSTLNAEFGVLVAAEVLGAWDAATGVTPAAPEGARSDANKIGMVAVGVVAVAAFVFVAVADPFGGSDVDSSPTAITTRPPPATTTTAAATTTTATTTTVPATTTTTTVPATTTTTTLPVVVLPLAERFEWIDFTRCAPRLPPDGFPTAAEAQGCDVSLTSDGDWWYAVDILPHEHDVVTTYTLELYVWPDLESYHQAQNMWDIDPQNPPTGSGWSTARDSGVFVDVQVLRSDGTVVNGMVWTYDASWVLAVGWPYVDDAGSYRQAFLEAFAPWS